MEPSPETEGSVAGGEEEEGEEDVAEPETEVLVPGEGCGDFFYLRFIFLLKQGIGVTYVLLHDGEGGIHDGEPVQEEGSAQERELQQLKRRVRELEAENDFLKKVSAYFARNPR